MGDQEEKKKGKKAEQISLDGDDGGSTTTATKILPIKIEDEMRNSYIDYAMSVIVGRALPDARDGLKPVHRRILFAMDELGLAPNRPYKKSARVVGEVLGKYHPHGDSAVYDSMVRMAQGFSLRYQLVDGQGNFGSVDGDSPAAMRYTEARLSRIAMEMLADIDKETVNFSPNFDESLKEPSVLPAKFPNLLVNGSSGIAVGMATNIPPHNMTEVIEGVVHVIDNPDAPIEDLMKSIKGPDFPTGGLICGREGIRSAQNTGRGLITVRARHHIENLKNKKDSIIVTELPYQVNKASLIEHIADLVRDKKITGISDLRDESDRTGMRIYIELKRDANSDIIVNQLFKLTDMQVTFGVNTVALVGGEPKLLNLKQLIDVYIKHREEVIVRRTQFELKNAEKQAHILEGLIIALNNLDAVIKLIRGSKNPPEAKAGLMEKFKLTDVQAQAILDMRLQRLTGLEREKIEEEYARLMTLIAELKAILGDRQKVLDIIKTELSEIKTKYGDERRTEIIATQEDMVAEDLIPDTSVAILITRDGFIKRMPINLFRSQGRGGRGVAGMGTREEDIIEQIYVTTTHKNLLFFTNKGRVHRLKAYQIPETSRVSKGQSVAHVLNLEQGEMVTASISVAAFDANTNLFMATERGVVKKTSLQDFSNIRKSGIIAIKLKEDDELRWVKMTDGQQELILLTRNGMMIRFSEKDVRAMGRTAAGVRGIALRPKDKVVAMDLLRDGHDILIVTKSGSGKRTRIAEYGLQRRGGKGHIAIKTRADDKVSKAKLVDPEDELLMVTAKGTMTRQKVGAISTQGRYAKGVRIQRLDAGDEIVDIARIRKEYVDAENAEQIEIPVEEGEKATEEPSKPKEE